MQELPISTDSQALSPQPFLRPIQSHSSSLSEEMWSRGSIYEKQVGTHITGPMVAVPAVDQLEALYLYECGGVVVYDSKASIAEEQILTASLPLSKPELRKKGLDLSPEEDKKKYLSLPAYPPFPVFSPTFQLTIPSDSLRFESRFESGNLKRAIRRQEREYLLLLQEDRETKGHTQWYFFSVKCCKMGIYRFNIANLYKERSLYMEGMQPAVRSVKRGNGWERGGTDIEYAENSLQFPNRPNRKSYSLSFTYEFLYEDDTVYFAHAVPYTYTDLNAWLRDIQRNYGDKARVDPLCQTIAGNLCEIVTITQAISTYKSFASEAVEWNMTASSRKQLRSRADYDPIHCKKKGIVLTARVHPGESAGSYMVKGAVDYLLSSAPEAVFLRSQYVIKVVPMLNPDGVRYGNNRCSLLGVDLNRRWRIPNRYMHPTIYSTKRMIQVFAELHEIALFCDFHGHSYRRNAFLYGCTQSFMQLADRKANFIAKMVPLLLSERNSAVSWSNCSFRQDRFKESTARLVVYNEFKVVNSYTLEASFYGPERPGVLGRADLQFLVSDYEQIGKDLMSVTVSLANKSAFYRNLTHVKDLLRTLEASQQLDKCKSSAFIHTNSGIRSPARLSIGQSVPDSKESEEFVSEQAEKRLWDVVLEYDGKIGVGNACEDSDSSRSEEGDEGEKRENRPGKQGKRADVRVIDRKLQRNSPEVVSKVREKPLMRRLGPLITPPKVFRSDRAIRSPLLSSSRTPLRIHQYGDMQPKRRGEDPITPSPSSSSALLASCFEPLVLLTTDPTAIRTLISLNRPGKLTVKGPVRVGSLGKCRGNEGMQSRKSPQGEEIGARKTVGRRICGRRNSPI